MTALEQEIASWPAAKREAALAVVNKAWAEKSLHAFVKQAWPIVEPGVAFVDNWHISGICLHLESVAAGKINKILINVPPGACKSLLTCVLWPAWVWTTRPQTRFLFASYAADLSMRDSIRCRDVLLSDWYQERWPLKLQSDQNTKGLFENNSTGWRMATSVGGRATGMHPDVVAVDDPINALEATSTVELQAVNEWWDGTMSTRGISRGVKQVGIMQRLHALDWSAHVLGKGDWEHICLPMRFEKERMKPTSLGWTDPRTVEGELFWPGLFPEDKVINMETTMGIYHAAGQLQQRPSPRDGGMFRREWFKVLPYLPRCCRFLRFWDKAGSKGGTGARTAGVLVGEYEDIAVTGPMRMKYVVIDVVTGRWQAPEREAIIKQTAESDRALYGHVDIWVEAEPGSGGKESAEGTVANLIGFNCKYEHPTGPKEVRADNVASQASVGRVAVMAAHWTNEFMVELEMFPVGKLKDVVDGLSGAFNKLCAPSGGIRSASEVVARPRENIFASRPLNLSDF